MTAQTTILEAFVKSTRAGGFSLALRHTGNQKRKHADLKTVISNR
jgi:hypothetical protein